MRTEGPAGPAREPVFDRPVWRDWLLWFGVIMAALSAYGSVRDPYLGEGAGFAQAIDFSWRFAVTFLIVGYLPAAFRRGSRERKAAEGRRG